MYTSYSLEQVATHTHTERLADAEHRRLARELRRQRRQRTTPDLTDIGTTEPRSVRVRVPRQRRWVDAFAPAGR